MRAKIIPAVAAAVVVALVVVAVPKGATSIQGDPSAHPVPTLVMPSGKSMVAVMSFKQGQAPQASSTRVVYAKAPGLTAGPRQLELSVVAQTGAVLRRFDAADPLSASVFDGRHNHRAAATGTGTFIMPFDPRMRTLQVRQVLGNVLLASVDLSGPTRDFCRSNPNDADCASDLSVTVSDAPDPVAAGTELTYTIRATNSGPAPAQAARIRQTLPTGSSFAGGSGGCTASGAEVTCDIGFMGKGTTATRTVRALVREDLVYNNGSPLNLSSNVRVDNTAGAELDPSDNTATATTRAVAVADLAVVDAQLDAPLRRIVIGRDVDVAISIPVTSSGPSSPMDAIVRAVATPAGGTSASGPVAVPVTALRSQELRSAAADFTLGCSEPGEHTFTFDVSIRPARPDDTDPRSSNDSMRLSTTVDCVIPVAFNIKPGTDENPANLRLKGVVPTAVLTTRTGEYELPLAVNAARIDAETVRFGPERLVFHDLGGSQARHHRGHIEDSYELDEQTRDGDMDMVLHFPVTGSGLATSDEQGCILGTLSGPTGQRWTFFGCDEVRYVPSA